ncbi:hypothetical protein SDJN02_05682 [Cucurbita argyrosperma subsp. argyrosperma]|uniref:Uncharacterized protein LOC111445906 n=1 Tax=Cucurbita moschata TaxID=3662 RepID=A0A6J1FPY6_CUCMO|nr:uncharacterized protein LOC111445906 [Cucurbita moschata]KAG7031641.1 hypothetical protein SDJN02_05682 [Cucurbita argyrosperma subsp. argyrosperma]
MQPSPPLISGPSRTLTTTVRPSTMIIHAYHQYLQSYPKFNSFIGYKTHLIGCGRRFPAFATASSGPHVPAASAPSIQSDVGMASRTSVLEKSGIIEEDLEKAIYRCRFMAFLGVFGSLVGSILCFIKGCVHVAASFSEYFVNRGKVIMLLVEAIDVYLLGTVMLVFGTGLYELFISHLGTERTLSKRNIEHRSNLFGLFTLKERPKWMNITTVNELKTKLGHVIVMLLLIGFFDKSKKAAIQSPGDLLCLAASVFLSSGSLFLLSKLTE